MWRFVIPQGRFANCEKLVISRVYAVYRGVKKIENRGPEAPGWKRLLALIDVHIHLGVRNTDACLVKLEFYGFRGIP